MFYVQVNDGINENGQLDQVRNFFGDAVCQIFSERNGQGWNHFEDKVILVVKVGRS